ncbi:MAG: PspC domain-containing protein [Dehalococcoidia bacterium]
MRKLYRSRENKMFAGILGGFGEMLSVDPTLLRLGFVFVCFLTGFFPVILAYLVGWVIIPLRPPEQE